MDNSIKDDIFSLEEEKLFVEADSPEVPPADIVAFSELRSVADLARMRSNGQLVIDPDFQREFVWRSPEQTRFIDSLIKQLPIPSICLSLDYKTQTWQVIDGLQRISTVVRFLDISSGWRLSRLDDINQDISGRLVSEFCDDGTQLGMYRRIVENTTIPINVLRCDYSNVEHQNYIFEIFHRLNSGGRPLSNQEIRNCIYSGSFNTLINTLNKNEKWLRVSKLKTPVSHRYKGQEMILRFFAFFGSYEEYTGRLAKFLNTYMSEHKNESSDWLNGREEIFNRTIDVVNDSLGEEAHGKSLALFEAFLVGIARNIERAEGLPVGRLQSGFAELDQSPVFSQESLSEGLASREKLVARLKTAEQVIRNV